MEFSVENVLILLVKIVSIERQKKMNNKIQLLLQLIKENPDPTIIPIVYSVKI